MHRPVLLQEVLQWLNPQPGGKFIDATINDGGHALAILERIVPEGKLLGIEWDGELLKQLEVKIQKSKIKNNLVLINDSYVNLKNIAEREGFTGADGILFDLGLSSWQLEESGRGFSFQKDEILDMRFNKQIPISALEIVNTWPEGDLVKIFREYGEEKRAEKIAKEIVAARQKGIIKTSRQLAEVAKRMSPSGGKTHPATKIFQALRIAVNQELANVEQGLKAGFAVLSPGGRLAVISFQGLEDKIIKKYIKELKQTGEAEMITKNAVKPSWEEVKNNPRARSAKLRVIQKT